MKTFDVNMMAHFWTVKAFLPGMIENKKGHIVNVASLAGQSGTNKLVTITYLTNISAEIFSNQLLPLNFGQISKNNR
jgi:NADP-dependent 3-hydroxy acid dehydrogenase YdfG